MPISSIISGGQAMIGGLLTPFVDVNKFKDGQMDDVLPAPFRSAIDYNKYKQSAKPNSNDKPDDDISSYFILGAMGLVALILLVKD